MALALNPKLHLDALLGVQEARLAKALVISDVRRRSKVPTVGVQVLSPPTTNEGRSTANAQPRKKQKVQVDIEALAEEEWGTADCEEDTAAEHEDLGAGVAPNIF